MPDRPILPGPLRLRLALPFAVLFAVVLILLSVTIAVAVRRDYLNHLGDEADAYARTASTAVTRAYERGLSADEFQRLVDELAADVDARVTLIGADGVVVADSDADAAAMANHATRPEVIEARSTGSGRDQRRSGTNDIDYLYAAVALPSPEGTVVRVAMPLDSVVGTIQVIWWATAIASVVAVGLAVGMSWFIAGRIVQPLEQLRAQSRLLAGGDLTARVEPSSVPEFAEVGYAFNRMASELQASHEDIEQEQRRLEGILRDLTDGVVITDADGYVLRMNPAAERLLDTTEESGVGRPFVQASRDHELQQVLQAALDNGQIAEATVEHGLSRRILLTTAQVVPDGDSRLGLVVVRDVSELRRLESVRREFVANVSHELRTPITSIRAMVETLEAGAIDEREIATDFLGRIVVEVDRLNALVEDLLDLARLEAGRTTLDFERTDPVDLARRSAGRLQTQLERAQLTLDVHDDGAPLAIPLDPDRMEQVLINLLHNAIKFTPPHGRIDVRVSQVGRETTIAVTDTGVGIPHEEQERLFERFYKSDKARRSEGTGLGLAIAKHIVQAHGGTISVQSEPGEGATFRVVLPGRRIPKSRQRA